MKRFIFAALLALSALLPLSAASRVEIKDGWFYVDGEKYFVKAIGYELGSRPGMIPWKRPFKPEHIRHDMKLLKDAGFNTIRTWAPQTPQELAIYKEFGMMVIQGLWFDWEGYAANENVRKQMDELLTKTVESSRDYDNILFYSVMNEPDNRKIMTMGPDKFTELLRSVRETVRKADPDKPVSFSAAQCNTFLDLSPMDLLFVNSYIYVPSTSWHAMNYRNYLEWTRERVMPDKPFILGEYGLSVSKKGDGRKFGYGGNTEADQNEGDIYMFNGLVGAGLQGGTLFMWNDGWWKAGNEFSHDDHAEEWYGVVAMENIEDWKGRPRPVYYSFKEINKAVVLNPKQADVYAKDIPIEIYAEASARKASYSYDGKTWVPLAREGKHWWKGKADAGGFRKEAAAGDKRKLYFRIDGIGLKPVMRETEFWVSAKEKFLPELKVTTDKDTYESGDSVLVRISLKDASGAPLAGRKVLFALENMVTNAEKNFEGITGPDGVYEKKTMVFGDNAVMALGCGSDFEKDGLTRRLWDARLFALKGVGEKFAERINEWQKTSGEYFYDFEIPSEDFIKKNFPRIMSGSAGYTMQKESGKVRKGDSALKAEINPEVQFSWGYAEAFFDKLKDISEYSGIGAWINGDGSGNELKIMLIDQDEERWFGSALKIDWSGWQKKVFALKSMQRDPYDGVTGGNEQPDFDKMKGIALVMTTSTKNRTSIILDDFELYR